MTTARFAIGNSGLDGMIEALKDLSAKGIPRAQAKLDDALDTTAEASRTLAHLSHDERHSGALKASQSHSSEHGPTYWVGQIAYTDRGAPWEMQRSGEHSAFIDSLTEVSAPDIEDGLDEVFSKL